ncbi:MAG: P1 family peptidase, partial [Azospirillaceae bacterium]
AAGAAAGMDFALGSVGAGAGATAGPLAGGLGSASAVDPVSGLTVGALVAANPRGGTVIPGTDTLWAWALEVDGEFGGQPVPAGPMAPDADPLPLPAADPALRDRLAGAGETEGANTTLAVVATDAVLSRVEALRLAIMAQDGLAMAIHPAHTPFDGDTVFALSTGRRALPEPRPAHLARLGALAARCLARAIGRGIVEATGRPDAPAYRDRRRRR